MQLETDQRQEWTGPRQCPMYNRVDEYCFSKAKPYNFCLYCRANEERIRSMNKPKPLLGMQNCLNFDMENKDCITCKKKRSGSNKSCFKKSSKPFLQRLEKRRSKRKRLLIHQNQKPQWKEYLAARNKKGE